MRRRGFTLIEIMISVAIIGLLAAIAIPNFMRARTRTQQSVCWNSLRHLNTAKDQYVLETGLSLGSSISPSSVLNNYLVNVNVDEKCPAGGDYQDVDLVGTAVTCSIHGSPGK